MTMTPAGRGRRAPRLRDRSTGDILVLAIAGTVCFVVVATTAALIVEQLIRPNADQSGAAGQIGDVINTLIGLLAGFLAGRTESTLTRRAAAPQTPPRHKKSAAGGEPDEGE